MTIALGFTCQNGIVLASDSQMSIAHDKYKQWDEPKIFPVKFSDGSEAIAAISGSIDSANAFRQIFETVAASVIPEKWDSIANAAESALKQTRSRLLAYITESWTTAEERNQCLSDNHFAALLAFYHKDEPFIFSLNLSHGIAVRNRKDFAAIGCGQDIAGYLLTGANLGAYELQEASGLAFYAIHACKKFDQWCGGDTQSWYISQSRPEKARQLSRAVLGLYGKALSEIESTHHLIITKMISEAYQNARFELEKEFKNE